MLDGRGPQGPRGRGGDVAVEAIVFGIGPMGGMQDTLESGSLTVQRSWPEGFEDNKQSK